VPVILITVGTYFIADIFFGVYNMAVDTLFLCFLEVDSCLPERLEPLGSKFAPEGEVKSGLWGGFVMQYLSAEMTFSVEVSLKFAKKMGT
jgi:hypothetical protein